MQQDALGSPDFGYRIEDLGRTKGVNAGFGPTTIFSMPSSMSLRVKEMNYPNLIRSAKLKPHPLPQVVRTRRLQASAELRPLPQVVLTRRALGVLVITFLVALLVTSCYTPEDTPASNMAAAREAKKERKELRDNLPKIAPFFKTMAKPESFDWLASHNEPGQTFEEYLDADPVKPTTERHTIYVLPLGTFSSQQKKIVDISAGYIEAFYDLSVKMLPSQAIKRSLRIKDSRRNPYTKVEQIRSGYILDDVLKPMLPADAAALIAFTPDDLFPDASMSYVFGQASLENRVGVWSLARLDDNADFATFLRRTLKIAAHESGHMFSMRHCTKYECVMSGTNHLGETDRRPIDACPECTAKICWLSDADQAARYDKLVVFCLKNGLTKEAEDFKRKADAVRKA